MIRKMLDNLVEFVLRDLKSDLWVGKEKGEEGDANGRICEGDIYEQGGHEGVGARYGCQ